LTSTLGGDALPLPDQAEEDVFGADVVVAELERFPEGQLEHLLGARSKGDVARGTGATLPMISSTWARTASSEIPRDSSAWRRHPPLVDQPEEDVLRADVIVVEQAGFSWARTDDPPGSIREALEHACLLPDSAGPDGIGPAIDVPPVSQASGPSRTLLNL